MRKDPIISEDWKIGNTTYLNFKRFQLLDFSVSIFIVLMGLIRAWEIQSSFAIFIWVFALISLVMFELILDQRGRNSASRLILFSILLFITYITLNSSELLTQILAGTLLSFKFVIIPVQNFVQGYNKEILVPNNSKVQIVLDDHIARLSETYFAVESDKEFQSRVLSKIREFFLILIGSVIFSVVLFLVMEISEEVGSFILLSMLLVTSASFALTAITWYYEQRRIKKEKELEDKKVSDDELFPEMID